MFGQQADIFSLCLSSCPHENDLDRIQPVPETDKVDIERLLYICQPVRQRLLFLFFNIRMEWSSPGGYIYRRSSQPYKFLQARDVYLLQQT